VTVSSGAHLPVAAPLARATGMHGRCQFKVKVPGTVTARPQSRLQPEERRDSEIGDRTLGSCQPPTHPRPPADQAPRALGGGCSRGRFSYAKSGPEGQVLSSAQIRRAAAGIQSFEEPICDLAPSSSVQSGFTNLFFAGFCDSESCTVSFRLSWQVPAHARW